MNIADDADTIAVDFDGVLFKTHEKISEYLDPPNDRIESSYEIPTWDFVKERWGAKEFYKGLARAHADPTLEPQKQAIYGFLKLQHLVGPKNVYVLTNNQESSMLHIEDRLEQHGLYTRAVSSSGSSDPQEKMHYDWDILIDDSPLLNYPTDGRLLLRFGAGYNDSHYDWDDIVRLVQAHLVEAKHL